MPQNKKVHPPSKRILTITIFCKDKVTNKHIETDGPVDRQADRQTDRQTDRLIDRQIDRQTDR